MKALKTIRFDQSDSNIFENAAAPNEWAISGAFEFLGCDEENIKGKQKQAFSNGFLSVESLGRSTFVSVAEINQEQKQKAIEMLAQHFVDSFNAPSMDLALHAAGQEIGYTCELAQDILINSLFSVHRHFDENSEIKEEFRVIDAPSVEKPHTRIWEVVEE